MLVIKAYINCRQIDEIWIHNLGFEYAKGGLFTYRIEKPKGYEQELIEHSRGDGWQPLFEKTLKVLKSGKGTHKDK